MTRRILAVAAILTVIAAGFWWQSRGGFESATTTAPAGRVQRWPADALPRTATRLEFTGEERPATIFDAPGSMSSTFEVAPDTVLEFAVAVGPDVPGAARFEVVVQVGAPGTGESTDVFRESLPLPDLSAGVFGSTWALRRVAVGRPRTGAADVTVHLGALTWPDRFRVAVSVPLLLTPGARSTQPNVLLVGIDTLRSDHLGAYGARVSPSPHMDRLAAEGAVFLKHYAQGANTFISFPSIFTGQSPSDLGVGFDLTHTPLPDDAVTLTELAASAGYRTVAIIPDAYAGPALNLMQGFDEVLITRNRGNAYVFELARSFVAERARTSEPYLLFVHVMEVHDPYGWVDMPAEAVAPFYDGPIAPPVPYDPLNRIIPLRFHSNLYLRRSYTDLSPYTPPVPVQEQAMVRGLYDADIARTDRFVGTLRETLAAQDALDRTVMAVFSDHGEAFWEHEGTGAMHGVSVYDEVVRTPLIVRGPGVAAGTKVSQPTANLDLFPSIAALAGFAVEGMALDGVNLFGGNLPADRLITTQNRLHQYAAIAGGDKLVIDRYGRAELFDLDTDPREQADRSASEPARVAQLRDRLFETLDHRMAPEWTVLISGRGTAPCQTRVTATVENGRIGWVDSQYYQGVNEFERVSMSSDRTRIEVSARADYVDRMLMFEVDPVDAAVTFDVSADRPECGALTAGGVPVKAPHVMRGGVAAPLATVTPGITEGVFVGWTPAWKPRQWTVLNLLKGRARETLLTPELRERLRALGYIQR